jgi:hypothetical protein
VEHNQSTPNNPKIMKAIKAILVVLMLICVTTYIHALFTFANEEVLHVHISQLSNQDILNIKAYDKANHLHNTERVLLSIDTDSEPLVIPINMATYEYIVNEILEQ